MKEHVSSAWCHGCLCTEMALYHPADTEWLSKAPTARMVRLWNKCWQVLYQTVDHFQFPARPFGLVINNLANLICLKIRGAGFVSFRLGFRAEQQENRLLSSPRSAEGHTRARTQKTELQNALSAPITKQIRYSRSGDNVDSWSLGARNCLRSGRIAVNREIGTCTFKFKHGLAR